MPPSYNEVAAWNPEVMTSIANGIVQLQAHLEVEAPKAGNPVLDLSRDEWTGESRAPADDRASALTKWILGVSDEYGDIAAALTAGQASIRGAMTALANRTTLADADGYILDRGSRIYTVNFDPARAPEESSEFDAGKAYEHHSALHALGSAADDEVTAARDAINSALSEIAAMTPAATAANRGIIDSTLGSGDAEAIRNGTATPEQRGRFLRAMNLTPEQLEQLKAGEDIGLDPSRETYIKNALGLEQGMSLAGPAVTGAIATVQRRGNDMHYAYDTQRPGGRHSTSRAGMSADDIARAGSIGKNLARGANIVGLGVTVADEGLKFANGEQDGGDTTAAIVGAVGGGWAGGAMAGAAIGSFAGPVGTAIGAGIGAAIGSSVGASAGKWVKGLFD
ncbi:hypothetical protein GIY30_11110 [Gordonia sp. HNM0687]|uniref:Uncharacterized protein n=1 Tax=Gordonia mangrovi TaxID=2665643 RepID=A0A6L7GTR5_9ACTN|nr:hypothetical protein [Gordonia mangrovi]MXP21898.1 hypothetical protein [Gordonia mangrovi]UVF76267.1 hypothetical protein NWF22_12720 [Gordonia mangrovi]